MVAIGIPIPEQAYTEDYQEKVHLELKARRESFDSAVYVAPGANLRHYNLGVYFSPIRHLYIKAGYTAVRGVTWDYYQGDYPQGSGMLPAPESEHYAFNKSNTNTGNFLLGLAYLWPYGQAEVGYNHYFKDVFVNFGINIPLRKTYTLIPTRKISREEYDQLMSEWKNR